MAKEELEKEAEDIVYGMGYDTYESDGHSDFAVQDILIKSLEPREKQIQIDAEQIRALQRQNGELTDKIKELEKQLKICETNADTYYDELTKLQEQLVKTTQIGMTCSNCKWSQYDEDEMCYCCSNKDKWELKLRR